MQDDVLRYIEEILDVENGTLRMDAVLREYVEWDSLAAISFLALADSKYGKKISSAEMKNVITVRDLINLL